MGFTVTNKQITMPQFNQTMGKIYQNQQFDDVKSAYKMKRLVQKIETVQKRFYEMYGEIQKKYVIEVEQETKNEETGEVKKEMVKKIDPERQQEFTNKINELGEIEVEIDWHQLSLKDLEGLKLTAMELTNIEAILEADLSELPESQPPRTSSSASAPATEAASPAQ